MRVLAAEGRTWRARIGAAEVEEGLGTKQSDANMGMLRHCYSDGENADIA